MASVQKTKLQRVGYNEMISRSSEVKSGRRDLPVAFVAFFDLVIKGCLGRRSPTFSSGKAITLVLTVVGLRTKRS